MRIVADYFICPGCGSGELSVSGDGDSLWREGIVDARMLCAICHNIYPIINGITRFVSSVKYAGSFGLQRNRHRRTQLNSYTGIPISAKSPVRSDRIAGAPGGGDRPGGRIGGGELYGDPPRDWRRGLLFRLLIRVGM